MEQDKNIRITINIADRTVAAALVEKAKGADKMDRIPVIVGIDVTSQEMEGRCTGRNSENWR